MLIIQIFIVAFVIFAASRSILRFREGALGRGELALWLLFWSAVGVAALLPRVTEWFARLLGVGRGVDAAIYVSIILLFYLVFRIFVRLDKIDHDLTLLVRRETLDRRRGDDRAAKP
jgi:hypothetical protein